MSGKNGPNILSKAAAANGSLTNIMSILRELPLGKDYFVVALLLRQT